jgi:hypothetical protein
VIGLATHVIAKVTSLTLRILLRELFDVDVQSFSYIS